MSYKAKQRYINPRPRHRTIKSFKNSFGGVNYFEYEFKNLFIVVNIKYAFNHFKINTKKTLTFYKPFKSSDGIEHMVMFKLHKEENNKYYFKTIYKQENLSKIQEIIEATDKNTVYFKYE